MNKLTASAMEMLNASGRNRVEAEHRFIEILTFSKVQEIIQMLREVLAGEEFLALPVWARNLSYRLACLQEPHNPNILRKAAADLRCFGPDWDGIADDLDQQADRIVAQS